MSSQRGLAGLAGSKANLKYDNSGKEGRRDNISDHIHKITIYDLVSLFYVDFKHIRGFFKPPNLFLGTILAHFETVQETLQ